MATTGDRMSDEEAPKLLALFENRIEAVRVKELFESEGCLVRLESNLKSALDFSKWDVPDVLLCSKNFFEEISSSEGLSRDEYNIPTLVFLPWEEREESARLINSGAADVIYTPYTEQELSARVWNHLGLKEALASLERREVELKRLTTRLQSEKEDREKLLGIMAHDLKNPIIGIVGFLIEITSHFEQYSHDDLLRVLIELRGSAFRVRDLLMNLLDWARAMTRGDQVRLKPINLISIVDQIAGILDFQLSKKHLRIQTQFDVFQIVSDEDILSAALRNLLSNAIKFTPAGGSIVVTSSTHDKDVRIEVRDTGVGMDSAAVAQVLSYGAKKFTKGTDGERGTGLGLKLTRDLVMKLGGTLTIRSEVNKGTSVTITLPQALSD